MAVIQINRMEDLDQYQSTWDRLLAQTPGASFFQSLDWLRVYWRHFGTEQKLRVIILERAGDIIGILPLVLRHDWTRVGWVRVLTYPLQDWGAFFGPISPDPHGTLVECLKYIATRPTDWHLLDLRFVNVQEIDQGATRAAMIDAGFRCREQLWDTTTIVDFEGTWERYLGTRSGKFRNNLRRAESLALQAGGVTFERYRPQSVTADEPLRSGLFEECLELAERSWQATSLTGTTISHPTVREFFRELFGAAARAGALDINLLRCQDRLIAFAFNLDWHGQLIGVRIGYDRNRAHLSPGRLLLARLIEDSFRRGDQRLDMGGENMAFKQAWLTRTIESYRYTHYAPRSVRSQLLRLKHWLWPRQPRGITTRPFPARAGIAQLSGRG